MSLKKDAPSFMPSWMKSQAVNSPPKAEPTRHQDPTVDVHAPSPAVLTKLSGTATAYVPKFASIPAVVPNQPATTSPARQAAPQQSPPPVSSNGPTAAAPVPAHGAWAKRPPLPTSAAKPSPSAASAKPPTPASKPATPGGQPAHPYRSPGHKPANATEVAIAASRAKLSKGAVEFRPRMAMPPPMPMKTLSAPPTPSTKPVKAELVGEEYGYPLNHVWALYYLDRSAQGTTTFDPALVYEIRCLEDFWRSVNNVPTVTNGNIGSTYYFFRNGIMPKWEDSANIGGGAWTLRLVTSRELEPDTIDAIWERFLCMSIGESYPSTFNGNVNGLVGKMRGRVITVQFWVSRRIDDFPNLVSSTIGDLYSAFKMEYMSHEASKAAAVEREREEQEKAKQSKKKDGKKRNY